MSSLKKYYGYGTAVLTVVFCISVGMPYWIHVTGGKTIGMFASSSEGTDATFKTVCSDEFSEMECGYLHSSRISAVLSIIFGGIATGVYLLPPAVFSALPTFLALSASCFQMIFSIIAAVLWYYFKNKYYDDDGVNREYYTPEAGDLTFDAAFYLWVIGSIASTLMTFSGFYLLSTYGKSLDHARH